MIYKLSNKSKLFWHLWSFFYNQYILVCRIVYKAHFLKKLIKQTGQSTVIRLKDFFSHTLLFCKKKKIQIFKQLQNLNRFLQKLKGKINVQLFVEIIFVYLKNSYEFYIQFLHYSILQDTCIFHPNIVVHKQDMDTCKNSSIQNILLDKL